MRKGEKVKSEVTGRWKLECGIWKAERMKAKKVKFEVGRRKSLEGRSRNAEGEKSQIGRWKEK
jgi:hypothetical protein